MSKKSFNKGWIYDKLTDIFIVIIGITIAFQLNSWKENATDNTKMRYVLAELQSEIESDSLQIQSLLEGQQKKHDQLEIYIGQVNDNSISNENFFAMHQLINEVNYFEPNLSTFNMVMSTGEFLLIKDQGLRKQISDYYDSMDQSEFYDENEKKRLDQFNDIFLDNYLFGGKEIPEGIAESIRFKNLLEILFYNLKLKIGVYNKLSKNNAEVLQGIRG